MNSVEELISKEYQHGFVTEIESDYVPRGLSEEIIRLISAKKNEPELMRAWRPKAYSHWMSKQEPEWSQVR